MNLGFDIGLDLRSRLHNGLHDVVMVATVIESYYRGPGADGGDGTRASTVHVTAETRQNPHGHVVFTRKLRQWGWKRTPTISLVPENGDAAFLTRF